MGERKGKELQALQTYREEEITDDSGIAFGTLHDAINYRSPFYGEKVDK